MWWFHLSRSSCSSSFFYFSLYTVRNFLLWKFIVTLQVNPQIRQLKSTLLWENWKSEVHEWEKEKKCKIIIRPNWAWNKSTLLLLCVHNVNLSTIANGCYLLSDYKNREIYIFMTQSCQVIFLKAWHGMAWKRQNVSTSDW